jgi:hypothetical protein
MAVYKNSPPDTLNFVQATGITDLTQIRAISTLVTDFKYAGIWNKFKAIYPFIGGTSTTHKFNLKDPRNTLDAYVITFGSGWTHSSNGILPNGTVNGTATFGIIPSRDMSDDSAHISIYSRTNTIGNIVDIGYYPGSGTNSISLYLRWGDGTYYNDLYNYTSNRVQISNSNSQGFYILSRQSANILKAFKNGTQVGSTSTTTVTGRSSLTGQIVLGGRNDGYYSNREYAFASVGDGLSDSESLAYYTAVQKYQTTLNRQV